MDVSALRADLEGIRLEDNAKIVQQKSRDFYWYSPVLKRQLDHVTADLVVTPKSKDELLRALAACYRHDVPVTPRGTGTGNYGQAMPLSGGVLLDLSTLDRVLDIGRGQVTTEPGAILAKIDRQTREHSQQELRLHPSTYNTASLGGFIAGGSGGVGSIRWGGLRDFGNVIGLEVATMEEEPRLMQLSGADLHKVCHAYGTNGIITEVTVPLAQACSWVDVIIGFPTLKAAARYANDLGEQDGLAIKELAVVAAPVPHDYFLRHKKYLPRDRHAVIVMVADFALDAMLALTGRYKNAEVLFNAQGMATADLKGLPPAFELGWNHTTLRALRVDPTITYLQVLYPYPDQLALVEKIHDRFGDEVQAHLEFVRYNGKVTCFGLPLVRFTSEERLEEIMAIHEDMGAPIFNPHRYTLEEGGMKETDAVQLAFKKQTDPKGLFNPGKMIAWDDPDFDFSSDKTYLFPGLQRAG